MNPVVKYFNGERLQCAIGILFAALSIGLALYLYFKSGKSFFTGFSYPFIIIPVLLLIICVGVVIRAPKDIARVEEMRTTDPSRIASEEMPRMETVMRNFKIIIWAELAFIAAASVLFFFNAGSSTWRGVAMGLFIQAAALLLFDVIANRRGQEYYNYLQTFKQEEPVNRN